MTRPTEPITEPVSFGFFKSQFTTESVGAPQSVTDHDIHQFYLSCGWTEPSIPFEAVSPVQTSTIDPLCLEFYKKSLGSLRQNAHHR